MGEYIDVTPISRYQFLPDQIMDRFFLFTAITPCCVVSISRISISLRNVQNKIECIEVKKLNCSPSIKHVGWGNPSQLFMTLMTIEQQFLANKTYGNYNIKHRTFIRWTHPINTCNRLHCLLRDQGNSKFTNSHNNDSF